MNKTVSGIFLALLLTSVFTTALNIQPVKAPDPWLVIDSNDVYGLSDGFQPVQVVWQTNYTASIGSQDRMGDMDFTSFGRPSQSDVEWTAKLPMVLGKGTYLFGATSGSRFIWFSVRNWDVNSPYTFRFIFTIRPDGTELDRSGFYTVPAATQDQYGYVHPGVRYCPIQAPFPVQPFQFMKAGPAQIEVTLDQPTRNKFIVHVNVEDTHGLNVLYVPIRFNLSSDQDVQTIVTVGDFDMMTRASTNFINGTYPVAGNKIKGTPNWQSYYVPYIGGLVTFGKPPTDEDGVDHQVRTILKTLNEYKAKAGGPYDRIVGVLPRDWITDHWCYGKFKKWENAVGLSWPANKCPIVLVEEGYPTVMAHEIGHTYGLPRHYYKDGEEYSDTVRGCPASGWWVKQNINMSDMHAGMQIICFMGKGSLTYDVGSIQNWVDKDCFRYLLTKFAGGDPEILYVSGWICKNNTASFEDVSRLPYGTPDVMLGATGNYSIALLDESGTVIAQAGFNVTFTAEFDVDFDPILFGLGIPWVNGTRQIQIRNATDVLASKSVSLNPPTVTVKFPNGGEILEPNTNYTITWEASDPDGDALTYSILYSDDNGSTWLPLATDIHEASYNWTTRVFHDGSENLIKVQATDGVNTAEGTSDSNFTITGHDDIAITNVVPSKTVVGQGYPTSMSLTLTNRGDFIEIFDVTLYANTTSIQTQTLGLTSGSNTTQIFTWNTTSFVKGNYTIWAYAWPVSGETNIADNNCTGGWVKIGVPGDLNNDGKCNILDLVLTAGKFGAQKGNPDPHAPKYDPNYDFNDDNKINILDLVIIAGHFGAT